jgi:hypothetical protein
MTPPTGWLVTGTDALPVLSQHARNQIHNIFKYLDFRLTGPFDSLPATWSLRHFVITKKRLVITIWKNRPRFRSHAAFPRPAGVTAG